MKILIACEESQTVCKAFRKRGHEAYSADIQDCSGGHPEWHIKGDVLPLLKEDWDLVIAHPPCTYLSVSGLHWNKRRPERAAKTEEAIKFFMEFTKLKCMYAIENPVCCISSHWRKPDQIIQPYEYGHDASKKTCLWLQDLPKLQPTEYIEGRLICCGEVLENDDKYGCPNCEGEKVALRRWANQTDSGQNVLPPSKDRAKLRSKTFQGIADAMAEQWSLDLT